MTDDQKADFCDNYCKYSWVVKADDVLAEICEDCPLNDVEERKCE